MTLNLIGMTSIIQEYSSTEIRCSSLETLQKIAKSAQNFTASLQRLNRQIDIKIFNQCHFHGSLENS